jgi:hypothetical protein
MNVESMLNVLSFRLDDPLSRTFEQSDRLDALNDAQLLAIEALDNEYFRAELGSSQDMLLTGAGGDAIGSLPSDIIGDRVTRVSRISNPNHVFKMCDPQDTAKFSNRYLAPTLRKPVGYIEAGNFHSLLASDNGVTVKVQYIRTPKTLVKSNPGAGETDTPELNEILHPLIVLMAEAICWASDDEAERAQSADAKVERFLGKLNQKGENSETKQVSLPRDEQ